MTFDEMKKAVGRRASDPNATRYSDAIEDYILDAIGSLLLSEDLLEEQVQPVIDEITRNITTESGIGKIEISETNFPNVLKIVKPFFDPISTNSRILVEDTIEKFNFRKNNPILQPDEDEGFWVKDGKYIRFYIESSDRTTPIKFKVINNPTDLESTIGGYGNQFLYQCIDLASAKLRNQIGME